jgi:alpha/beta superfamily hydrolase
MFVKKNRIKTDLAYFHMGDPNVWIDKISLSWSGSIPATLIVTKDSNHFFEQEFHSQEELNAIIDPLLIKHSNK